MESKQKAGDKDILAGKASQDKWTFDTQTQIWLPKNKVWPGLQIFDSELDEDVYQEKEPLYVAFDAIRVGAIGISVIILQGYISVVVKDGTDLAVVLSLALSIPILAVAILLKHRGYTEGNRIQACDTIGMTSAGLGVLLTFFHLSYYAGLLCFFSILAALFMFAWDD